MKSKSHGNRRSGCPINAALEMIGDSWSLLIVRDLMFKGHRTFNEFQRSGEGIASNVLADRLVKLEAAGIIDKREHAADARRYEYGLTKKGIDLAPTMVELVLWAVRYEQTDAPPQIVRAMSTQRAKFLSGVRKGWEARH
jgi:DNA-binding HxlR family transcriptional regulator